MLAVFLFWLARRKGRRAHVCDMPKWNEPIEALAHYTDNPTVVYKCTIQQRQCPECGKVEIRRIVA
jgi:hypothetical protein